MHQAMLSRRTTWAAHRGRPASGRSAHPRGRHTFEIAQGLAQEAPFEKRLERCRRILGEDQSWNKGDDSRGGVQGLVPRSAPACHRSALAVFEERALLQAWPVW